MKARRSEVGTREGFHPPTQWSCAPCGKVTYLTRKAARRATRNAPGGQMRAYRCPANDHAWHLGHLAPAIVKGEKVAADVYPTDEQVTS